MTLKHRERGNLSAQIATQPEALLPEMYPECVIASWDALILLLDAENIE